MELLHILKRRQTGEYVLVTRTKPSWLGRVFGARPKIRRFVGSGTVWFEQPYHQRTGTLTECRLAELYHQGKHAARLVDPL